MSHSCSQPLTLDELIAYQRGELEPSEETRVEEHYFRCADCGALLRWVQALERAVGEAITGGLVDVGVTEKSLQRLERAGASIRRYELEPGGSVNCTIAPNDDMTVVTFRTAPAENGPASVHAEISVVGTDQKRQENWPALLSEGRMTIALAGQALRALPRLDYVFFLRIGEGEGSHEVGPFTMRHHPWEQHEESGGG
jgi:hypothetical protein